MQCPSCQKTLHTMTYEGIKVETCNACGGEWLDAEELGHVVKAREVRFSAQERQAIAQATSITGVRLSDVDRDLSCPKCDGTTDALNYGGDTGIILDRCTSCHGLWLDGGELEKVQQLIEGWEDGLEGDLAQYSERLHDVAAEVDANDDFSYSRAPFINAMINGALDFLGH
jgi:uncharacterized protein